MNFIFLYIYIGAIVSCVNEVFILSLIVKQLNSDCYKSIIDHFSDF